MARAVRIEIDGLGVAHGETKWIGETQAGVQWTWLDEGLNKRLTERYPELRLTGATRAVGILDRGLSAGSGAVTRQWHDGGPNPQRIAEWRDARLGERRRRPVGSHLRLELQAIGTVDALVVRRSTAGTAVRFTGMEEEHPGATDPAPLHDGPRAGNGCLSRLRTPVDHHFQSAGRRRLSAVPSSASIELSATTAFRNQDHADAEATRSSS